MSSSKDTPIYNLKAVVQETGIKPDTLRAWERRYNLPKPQRTTSGHRLYTERDIGMLHWLMARQDEGLSISRAIEMWQNIQQNGADETEATQPVELSTSFPSSTPKLRAPTSLDIGDATLFEMMGQWVKACINFDQQQADQILSQAFALFSAEIVCTKLIQRGLAQIGDDWYRGTVTVQQEHFASSIATRRLETMLTATPNATRNGRILIGNPPHEEHTFAPLMLSLLLRRQGWDVIYLGANVPNVSLDSTIRNIKPQLVILTAQQIHTAATLLEMSQILLQERTPLAFGGHIFKEMPEAVKVIPGYYLGNRLDESVKTVEQIMVSLRVKLAQRTVSQECLDAAHHFQEQRSEIEAALWHQNGKLGISQQELGLTNSKLGDAICASLKLGNIEYLDSAINWIESTLINHHRISAEVVNRYFEAYAKAVLRNLKGQGQIIRQWFAQRQGISIESAV